MPAQLPPRSSSAWGRPRQVQDIDRHVGRRIHERRIMLGLSMHALAERLGITHQVVRAYEVGTARVSAGRLLPLAEALDVEVAFFFDGLDVAPVQPPTPQQARMLELTGNFNRIPSRRTRQMVLALAQVLATSAGPDETVLAERPDAAA